MVEKKQVGIMSLIALGLFLGGNVSPDFFDEPKYFCDYRPDLGPVSCESFTKYVHENGKCVRNDDSNLICKTGWNLIIDDRQVQEQKENHCHESDNFRVCVYRTS